MKTILKVRNSQHPSVVDDQTYQHKTMLTLGMGFGAEAELAALLTGIANLTTQVAGLVTSLGQEVTARAQGDFLLDQRINNQNIYINQTVNTLNATITGLSNQITAFGNIYPKLVMAGSILMGSNAVVSRPSGSTIDFTDDRYAIILTPEGSHEAWNIGRNVDNFTISVFNRSGTNRVGHSGRVSYLVIQRVAIGA